MTSSFLGGRPQGPNKAIRPLDWGRSQSGVGNTARDFAGIRTGLNQRRIVLWRIGRSDADTGSLELGNSAYGVECPNR